MQTKPININSIDYPKKYLRIFLRWAKKQGFFNKKHFQLPTRGLKCYPHLLPYSCITNIPYVNKMWYNFIAPILAQDVLKYLMAKWGMPKIGMPYLVDAIKNGVLNDTLMDLLKKKLNQVERSFIRMDFISWLMEQEKSR